VSEEKRKRRRFGEEGKRVHFEKKGTQVKRAHKLKGAGHTLRSEGAPRERAQLLEKAHCSRRVLCSRRVHCSRRKGVLFKEKGCT
jgi:hypothetical protein